MFLSWGQKIKINTNYKHRGIPHLMITSLVTSPPSVWSAHCVYVFIFACTENLSTAGHTNFSPFLLLGILSGIGCRMFSSVQFSRSVVSDSETPWATACQASLSITNSQSSLKLTSIELVMPSSHLILCRPLLLLPPSPSQDQSLFQWVNSSHEVAKVLEFQL